MKEQTYQLLAQRQYAREPWRNQFYYSNVNAIEQIKWIVVVIVKQKQNKKNENVQQ